MRGAIALVLLACCSSPQAGTRTGPPSGSGSGQIALTGCDAARPMIEALYRTDAQQAEPQRVDEAVSDNTTMVMAACARAPEAMTACISAVTTVVDLEGQCMPPLDEEGSEADVLVP